MSGTTSGEERAVELAHQATQAVQNGRLSEAARLLREATTLAPSHPIVLAGWASLKELESRSPLLQVCRDWVKSRDEADGEKALKSAKEQSLSKQDGEEAWNILWAWKGEDNLLDEVSGHLLATANSGAQAALVKTFMAQPTRTYYELFERGDHTIDGLLQVIMHRDIWPSQEAFVKAHRDCFMLSLAMMMEEALDHPERAMKCVANLLAAYTNDLKGIIDADTFKVILESLDLRESPELRSRATLATVKLLEHNRETAGNLIKDFVTERVKTSTTHSLITGFSTAAAVFKMDAPASSALFLSDGFVSTLVPVVQKKKSSTLEKATLELLDSACVDKACRETILRHCTEWLQEQAMSGPRPNLAAAIMFKLSLERENAGAEAGKLPEVLKSPEPLIKRMMANIMALDSQPKKDAIEGLAFASLRPQARENIANNSQFLQALVSTLESHPVPEALFGGLSIFVNITQYLPLKNEEAKRMDQLRAYANAQASKQKPKEPDPLLAEAQVTARCKLVLDAGVMKFLASTYKQGSPGVLTSIVRIICALSVGKSHRGTLAQQAAPRVLLQIYDDITRATSKSPSAFPNAQLTLRTAAQALSRILISVNPNHIFAAKDSATAAIRPLAALLSPGENPDPAWQLYAFEALLALTNLASMARPVQDAITQSCFDVINDELLLSPNTLVRRAAAELICNLMESPYGIAKFADPGDKRSAARFRILLAITDVEDTGTRKAAGGALATMLDVAGDLGVAALVKQDEWARYVLGMVEDEDMEIVHRGVVCVQCVIAAEGEAGREGRAKLVESGAVDTLRRLVTECRNLGVVGVSTEALRMLVESQMGALRM